MSVDPNLLVLKPVSELQTVTNPTTGELLFWDGQNELKKVNITAFQSMIGGIAKPLALADASPTVEGWYKPTVSGTYANAGNLVAQVGYDTLFYLDDAGNWSKVEVEMPVDLTSIREADLTIVNGANLFNPAEIINGRYVSSTGSLSTVAGWEMILINIESIDDNMDISWGGIAPTAPCYWNFMNISDVSEYVNVSTNVLSYGTFISGGIKTVQKPTGAKTIGINIKRPADSIVAYENAMINIGTSLLPYESYSEKITKIKDIELAGSDSGGGDINAHSITTSILILNLPTSPSGLVSGRAWIDSANGNVIKVV